MRCLGCLIVYSCFFFFDFFSVGSSAFAGFSASTTEKDLRGNTGGNLDAARRIGQTIAERALAKGIEQVVFDRGGYLYHGRIKALTDAARAAGLNKNEAVAEPEAEAAPAAEPEQPTEKKLKKKKQE